MKITELPDIPVSNHPDILVFIVTCSLEKCREHLSKRLESSKNIKNPNLRKKINDRLFALKNYFSQTDAPNPVAHICLSYQNKTASPPPEVKIYPLSKRQQGVISQFVLPEFIDYTDTCVNKKRLETLFSVDGLISSLYFKGTQLTHTILDSTKQRTIDTISITSSNSFKSSIIEYINKNKNYQPFLLHGMSSLLKQISSSDHPNLQCVLHKNQTPRELLETHHNIIQTNLQIELAQFLTLVTNPNQLDRIIYGTLEKEILGAIQEYRLELLWIHKETASQFDNMIETHQLQENLNFTIKYVETLKKGDTADMLLQQYGGAIGQSYY